MRLIRALTVLACAGGPLTAQDPKPPSVVKVEPAHDATDVNASAVKHLVVTFDRDMNTEGWSFCGGGPLFPNFEAKPFWKTPRVCVVEVALEPDHDYRLSLNCPAAKNFRSARGVPLEPTPWSFTTRPARPLSEREQRAQNRKAFAELRDVLAQRYSYYHHRDLDWREIYRAHEKEILSSKSAREWAAVAAEMLRPTGDLHLYLRYRDTTFATGRRRVDTLFRENLLDRYFEDLRKVGNGVLTGETRDGIGYLLIGTFGKGLDIEAVMETIADLRGSDALIIDVRPNSGGNELLAKRVAAWFVDGVEVYAKNTYRTGKGKRAFGPVLDREIRGNAGDRRFAGPVAVLMSRYNMSSCEAFLLMMRQAAECTLIGQRSWGSSGNPKPHPLSNGVEIVAPSWKALRPDGTCFEGEGIAPDVEVPVTAEDLERHDPIIERALTVLGK